jgi:hypothetical protein
MGRRKGIAEGRRHERLGEGVGVFGVSSDHGFGPVACGGPGPLPVSRPASVVEPGNEGVGKGRHIGFDVVGDAVVRIDAGGIGAHHGPGLRRAVAEEEAQPLRREPSPHLQHRLRRAGLAEGLGRKHEVGERHAPRLPSALPKSGGDVGHERPAQMRRKALRGVRRGGTVEAPRHDESLLGAPQRFGQRLRLRPRRCGDGRRVLRVRIGARGPRFHRCGDRQGLLRGHRLQGLPKHAVDVHGPGGGACCAVHRLVGRGQDVRRVHLVGRRRDVHLPARVVAKDLDLIDRLIGTGVAQLGRAVGGKEKQGNAVHGGLHNGGQPVGDGGAGGGNPGRGRLRGAPAAERRKRVAPLVHVQHRAGLGVTGRGNG